MRRRQTPTDIAIKEHDALMNLIAALDIVSKNGKGRLIEFLGSYIKSLKQEEKH